MTTLGRVAAVSGVLALAIGGVAAQAPSPAGAASRSASAGAPNVPEGKGSPGKSHITDPRQQVLEDADAPIGRVEAAYPDVAAGSTWDVASQTLTVNVAGDYQTSGTRAEQYVGALRTELQAARSALNIRLNQVKYSRKALEDTANMLSAGTSSWMEGLRGFKIASWTEEGEMVTITVAQAEVATWRERLESASLPVPVVVLGGDGEFFHANSRFSDSIPFSGGMNLHADYQGGNVVADNQCTAGFTWTRWGGLGDAASTANHCVNPGTVDPGITNTYVNWENGAQAAGSAVVTSPASDTALLQGRTYHASVFVGAQDTTDWRWVYAIGTTYPNGQVIAFSGAISGLHSATVTTTYSHPTIGTLIGMSTVQTADGDSGGPWLTTQSGTGYAKAWGQHFGQCRASVSAPFRDCFVPLSRISAMTNASIKLMP